MLLRNLNWEVSQKDSIRFGTNPILIMQPFLKKTSYMLWEHAIGGANRIDELNQKLRAKYLDKKFGV